LNFIRFVKDAGFLLNMCLKAEAFSGNVSTEQLAVIRVK
jgi:hypothetical protein